MVFCYRGSVKEIFLLNRRRRIFISKTRKYVNKRARGNYEGVPVVYKQQ